LGDNSWSRRNGSIELPDKPDTLVMAILLHLDGSLGLESFSDFETACLIGAFDARTDFISHYMGPISGAVKAEIGGGGSGKTDYRNRGWDEGAIEN
jgi:hypothetical protein